MQALYQMDLSGTTLDEVLGEFESFRLGKEIDGTQYRDADAAFFRDIVGGVVRDQRQLDPAIHGALTADWPLARLDATLRAILRSGAYELASRPDVPARVVITEYVDVAKAFFEKDVPAMVNAVLDALAHSLRPAEFLGFRRAIVMAAGEAERPGEFALIEHYFRPLATDPGAWGLRDDAAELSPGAGDDLVLTTDLIAEGIHFFKDDPPAAIARKALRVNLSDLAAKGAMPVGYLMAIALPRDWTEEWIAPFAAALAEDQERYGISLLRRRYQPRVRRPHHLDHRHRQAAEGDDGPPRRSPAGRRGLRLRHDRRCRTRSQAASRHDRCGGGRGRWDAVPSRPLSRPEPRVGACAGYPGICDERSSTFPMAWSAISTHLHDVRGRRRAGSGPSFRSRRPPPPWLPPSRLRSPRC